MIMYYVKLYVCAFVGFLAIDMVWLTLVARGFYRRQLGFLLSDQPNWWAAISFYLLCSCSPLFPPCRRALCAGLCSWAASSAW